MSAKITGKVVMVGIEEGQRVERDEIIARLDDTNARATVAQARAEVEQSKANFAAAEVAFANASADVRAQRAAVRARRHQRADVRHREGELRRRAHGPRRRRARRRKSRKRGSRSRERNLDDTVVRAPFAGIVTVKAAQEGEMVSPISAGGGFTRTGIGTIVDMSSLEVEVDVSENFINRVVPQQPVTVRLNAYPDWSIPARVIAIIPTADRAKATVKVRVGFDAADARILPEMGARVAFLAAADGGATRPRRRPQRSSRCWCRRSRCRSTATPASCSSSPTAASSGAPCGSARRARRGRSCWRVSPQARAWRAAILPSLADGSRVRVEE